MYSSRNWIITVKFLSDKFSYAGKSLFVHFAKLKNEASFKHRVVYAYNSQFIDKKEH